MYCVVLCYCDDEGVDVYGPYTTRQEAQEKRDALAADEDHDEDDDLYVELMSK